MKMANGFFFSCWLNVDKNVEKWNVCLLLSTVGDASSCYHTFYKKKFLDFFMSCFKKLKNWFKLIRVSSWYVLDNFSLFHTFNFLCIFHNEHSLYCQYRYSSQTVIRLSVMTFLYTNPRNPWILVSLVRDFQNFPPNLFIFL